MFGNMTILGQKWQWQEVIGQKDQHVPLDTMGFPLQQRQHHNSSGTDK